MELSCTLEPTFWWWHGPCPLEILPQALPLSHWMTANKCLTLLGHSFLICAMGQLVLYRRELCVMS